MTSFKVDKWEDFASVTKDCLIIPQPQDFPRPLHLIVLPCLDDKGEQGWVLRVESEHSISRGRKGVTSEDCILRNNLIFH